MAIGCLCSATSTFAHPGHDLFHQGATHALTSPFHLFVLAVIGTGLFLAAKLMRSPKVQQSMRVGGAAMMLLSLLLWTLNH
jgi:hypothetical protein